MNGAPGKAQVAAIWTRDLFAGCQTGEFIEPPPPRERWRERLRFLPWVPLLAVGAFAWHHWLKVEPAAIADLMKTDRIAGLHRNAEFFTWCFGSLALVAAGASIWIMVAALRVLRAGRWPLPGARVQRRTPVIAGWCLWPRCAIPLLLIPVITVVIARSSTQLIAWAWNTYADARAGITVPAAHAGTQSMRHAAEQPNDHSNG